MYLDRAAWRVAAGGKGELVLSTSSPDARRLPYDFTPGEYEIRKKPKKRSLDQNAYCWVLIDKIAEAVHIAPEQVYRNAIRDIGGVSERICIQSEAAETFCRAWEKRGMGWQTETGPSKIKGCVTVTCWYGSSVYDTKQMAALLESLIQEAKALGIETLTPEELARLEGP